MENNILNILLFSLTFIFGPVELLTYTKLFNKELNGFFNTLYWKNLPPILKYIDVLIFISSLIYQINYWLL